MKLLSTTALFLTSLMITSTLANFHIEFENLPSKLRAGATYEVKWTATHEYVSSPHAIIYVAPITHIPHRILAVPFAIDPDRQPSQQVKDFLLVHELPNQGGWDRVRVIDHYLDNMTDGKHSMLWKAPALKNQRFVRCFLWHTNSTLRSLSRANTNKRKPHSPDATASTSKPLQSPTSACRRSTPPRTPI